MSAWAKRAVLLALAAAPATALPSTDWHLPHPLRARDIPGCSAGTAGAHRALPFGCATARNLEAMVADPSDLDRARPLPPAASDPAVAPVRRHRMGSVPEPRETRTTEPGP